MAGEVTILMLLAFTAGLLLDSCQTDEKVSFYGASYIHLSVQEAKSATDISFRFRTHLADAILLLAAGKTDYCLIKLESGMLKVRINLGAGEKELASASELRLNDLSWHEVNLTRRDANITLSIDVIHSVRDILPGRFFELNINFGVFIGGQGNFNELFFGHTEYLRGCMADIVYNGIRAIEHARHRRNSTEATAVSWGCSAEFDADVNEAMSFVEDGAFMSVPKLIPRNGSRWELELKTATSNGLLLFNAGHSSHADFLGIELVDGKIRLLMNKGNGPTELIHAKYVADGLWHQIQLDFTPNFIGITIDHQTRNMSLPSGNRFLDLADTLYIGGTELNKRAKALSKGIKFGDVSYKGCLRNMLLDGKELGLPHVKVSQGLVVNCVWGFPCAEAEPCVRGAMCSQLGVRSFKCTCDQDLCIKSNFTNDYKFNTNLPVSLEVLLIKPISVYEGKRTVIGGRNIAMILDIAKFGLNESHVIFGLLTLPNHGTVYLDKIPLALKTPFSLHDVNQHKIFYQHDGSETTDDSMILKIALQANSRHPLPGYFQDSLRFTLHVNVTPVNDPPRLEIPANAILKLAQGTRKTLTQELMPVEDADTPPSSLVYTILPNDSDVGHVEKLLVAGGYAGQTVNNFTLAELTRGTIDYVHSGKNKSSAVLGLKVSDGEATSQPQYLRITTDPLTIKLKYNTGLVVVHRSFSYLTPANLSFATNAEDARVNILFTIVKPPLYGILQRQQSPHHPWINVDSFTSRDLEQQAIRYLHNVGSPSRDSFKFRAAVREVHSPVTYDFNITFIILELREIHRSNIDFTNSVDVIIDSRKLKFQTNPLITDSTMIVYSLLEGPKYGHIILISNNLITERLRIGQTFTQEDIDTGRLRYKHFRRAFSAIEDWILFKVTAPQCSDVTTSLKFHYQPSKPSNLPENIQTLHVIEGHRVRLRMTRTNYRDFDITYLSFNLTERPRHGSLSIYNNSVLIRMNTTYFTSEELANEFVFYVHDDSETTSDSFEFLAMSSDDKDFMYIGTYYLEIELKNDNPPKRINQRIFHVVTRSEKLITKADLLYTDDDLNTKPRDLVYTVKQLSNGAIFNVNNLQLQINSFTQQDINDEKILYKHRGNKHERIDFTVNDGELFTNGELDIQPGLPYVKLLIHAGAIVQSNRSVFLSSKDIGIETNVYTNTTDIRFTILDRPKYGVILKYNRETSTFDREDLIRKIVMYKHIGITLKKDQFTLKVNVRGAEDTGIFTIEVLPESYWEPLLVYNNKTVYVEEATSVILNSKSLDIGHPEIPASRIVYHVKEWPKNGYLEVQTHEDNINIEDDDFDTHLVNHFEQNLINNGLVYYVQSVPNKTHDTFVIDITNGITWLRNLVVNIVIVPDKLYVAARNLTVFEGKSVILHETDFYAVTSYFAGKITDYRISEKPKHGTLLDAKNNPTRKFSHKQLNAREILYKNNGDEVSMDYFKMIALAGEKTSESFEVWINVLPINDEVPVVVNMTKFNIWQGGSMVITKELLAAVDNDTVPTELIFNVKNLINGYFSLVESPRIEIYNFSQEMINTFKVLFTHTNGSEAEFTFMVNDGLHSTKAHQILISTKPVRIVIERNRILNVFPLTRKPINNDLLLSKCTDYNRDIKYFIRRGPTMGKIIMETNEGTWLEVDRFTQNDLNNSRVSYEHNKQFNHLSANDSFEFDIETHFAAPIKNQVFKIDISVSSGGLHRYVAISPVLVDEGGSAPFSMNISGIINFLRTKAGIYNPEISIRLIRQPSHGHVMLMPDLNLTTFSQNEIESGKIAYYHDHSDTVKDEIEFTLYFLPGHVVLCNVTIPVDITPINDQLFKLETPKGIDVVQNQSQTITRDNLLTTDPDTGPEDILYEIVTEPEYGKLILLSSDQHSNSQIHNVKKFTQQDIDSSRLIYEHRGPLLLLTFYFRVSDKSFPHVYQVLNINVHPIKLNVTVLKPVEIQQGEIKTTIDTESIQLDTNVRQDLVSYEVTKSPKYGVLHARDQTNSFRHSDLLSKTVVYVQHNMTASNDSFELSARVSDFEVRHILVPIRVVPLIIFNSSLIVYSGDRTKLSKKEIDATPLAQQARSDPAFKITRTPKYAKIMRIMNRTMSSGEKRGLQEKEIFKFTHSQILSGLIYVVCKKIPSDDIQGVHDNFEFIVAVPQSAPRFQPALVNFDFRIKLNSDYYNNSLDGPMDPVGHEGEMAITPNMSNDYTLILGMLLGVFCLGICVIVTIRCKQSRYKDADDEDEEEDQDKVEPSSPSIVPLPRPPDHLLPATPHLKRYTNDHHNNSLSSSTPLPPMMPSLTSTLPQCKVIPLSPMENITGSEVDVSARYPYGVADTDDWSSFETTDLPCPSQTSQQRTTSNPLLRRNQYWV